ncbi:MAG: tetratricopeptide repeat protein [Pseudohongiella sp.]
MISRVLLVMVTGLVSACASYGPDNGQPTPVERSEPDAVESPAIVGPPMPPPGREPSASREPSAGGEPSAPANPQTPATAASTLLASVDTAIAAGDLERAAAIGERALRISPRDATVWYRLASIRFRQQNYDDARGLARRALSYAGSDASLRLQINDLLDRLNSL